MRLIRCYRENHNKEENQNQPPRKLIDIEFTENKKDYFLRHLPVNSVFPRLSRKP